MSFVRKTGPATYADVLAAPENLVAELIDGELFLSPRPRSRHARAQVELSVMLLQRFGWRGDSSWLILPEPELYLSERGRAMVPDLAGWRRERMPEMPDVASFTLAPDWVCEIISPSTKDLDRDVKMPRYAAAGVRHAWLLDPDPEVQALEVFRLEGGRWSALGVYSGGARVHAEPFAAVEVDLGALWAR